MRSDYLPSTSVCFVCGHLIHEGQIGGCIEGTITHKDLKIGVTRVDPFVGFMCHECKAAVQHYIEGGIPAAKRRSDEFKMDE